MKKVKKLATLLMAGLLLFGALPATARAADEDNLLTDAPKEVDLVIHKYLMDDVSKANGPSDGQLVAESALPAEATPLGGIEFKVYPVDIQGSSKSPQSGTVSVKPNLSAPEFFEDGTGNSFPLSNAVESQITDSKGTATFSNLPQGIYLVVEQSNTNTQVASPAAPFLVEVPMADPDGNGWLSTIHVYPKNEGMSIEKEVSEPTVTVGDVITYTITPSVPSDIGMAKKYEIADKLDTALDYQGDLTLKVKGLANREDASGVELILNQDYTVGYVQGTTGRSTLSVKFEGEQIVALEGAGYRFLEITFKTKVNKNIIGKEESTVYNNASINFTNQYDENKTFESKDIPIHTGGILIIKVDAKSGDPITTEDAKFKIASSEDNALLGIYLRQDSNGNWLDGGDDGYESEKDYEATTNEHGRIHLEGLKDYVVGKDGSSIYETYWLVETQAPKGYNRLNSPIPVNMKPNNNDSESSPYLVTIPVENSKGFILPRTGGTGTLLFTAGGIALIGLAAILVLTMRRKKTGISER